jgi:hypothetical protein
MKKICSIISLRITALFFLLPMVAFSNGISPAQNERLVVGQIKRLYDIQAVYSKNYGNGNFGTVEQLSESRLIDDVLAQGVKYGYVFTFSRTAATTTLPARFSVTARPRVYRKTGIRSFYMSSTCLVAGADKNGADAGPTDPVIDSCTPTLAYEYDQKALLGTRVVAAAQFTYLATTGVGSYGTHDQLVTAALLMNPYGPLGTPSLGHSWTVTPFNSFAKAAGFKAFATPMYYRETGIRSFFVDQTGVVRGLDRQGAQAHEDDPPIDPCASCSPAANEATAKFVARFLSGSEQLFAFGIGPGIGNGNYGTLHQLSTASVFYVPFIGNVFEGYVYGLSLTPASPGVAPRFAFTLTPQQYGVTGVRSFFIDETGVLRGADKNGAPADANDPPVLL